jgi:hypothetical protein
MCEKERQARDPSVEISEQDWARFDAFIKAIKTGEIEIIPYTTGNNVTVVKRYETSSLLFITATVSGQEYAVTLGKNSNHQYIRQK